MNNLLINEFQLNSCAYTLLTCCATVRPVVQPDKGWASVRKIYMYIGMHVPFQCWLLMILCLPAYREEEGLREIVNHPPGLLEDNDIFVN